MLDFVNRNRLSAEIAYGGRTRAEVTRRVSKRLESDGAKRTFTQTQLNHLLKGRRERVGEDVHQALAKALGCSRKYLRGDLDAAPPGIRKMLRDFDVDSIRDAASNAGAEAGRFNDAANHLASVPVRGNFEVPSFERAAAVVATHMGASKKNKRTRELLDTARDLVDLRFWRDVAGGARRRSEPSVEDRERFARLARDFFEDVLGRGDEVTPRGATALVYITQAIGLASRLVQESGSDQRPRLWESEWRSFRDELWQRVWRASVPAAATLEKEIGGEVSNVSSGPPEDGRWPHPEDGKWVWSEAGYVRDRT